MKEFFGENNTANIADFTGFVVLHFGDRLVTCRCLDSILAMDEADSCKVLIVDNDPGRDKAQFWERYTCRGNVYLLATGGGAGFSRANNEGYGWLRARFRLHAVVVCNNDVIFPQHNFIALLHESIERYHCDVLGPDILLHGLTGSDTPGFSSSDFPSPGSPSDNRHQNPMDQRLRTRQEARKTILLNSVSLALMPLSFPFINHWLIGKDTRGVGKGDPAVPADNSHSPLILFGACLIYSGRFLEKEDKAFWPETHFYYEEYILGKRCEDNGYRMVYDPSLLVFHESGRATRDSVHNQMDYCRRKLQNTRDSCKVYLSMFSG